MLSIFAASLFFSITVKAAVIHAPLYRNDQALLTAFSGRHGSQSTYSQVLDRPSAKQISQWHLSSADHSHRVEIWDTDWPGIFATAAAIGNPPQPFRLLIDLTWDSLFVPSSRCSSSICDKHIFRYSPNESSTYESGGSAPVISYGGLRFRGDLAFDTLQIAGLAIQRQPFMEAVSASPLGFFFIYHGFDGALGLAPRWNTSIDYSLTPSPWMMMVNQSLLDENLFAIELPQEPLDYGAPIRTGEISFGGINPKYASSKFIHLPLTQLTDLVWATEAQFVTWEDKDFPIHEDLNFTLAVFDTANWEIGLPWKFAQKLNEAVHPACDFVHCYIPCELRHKMPNLTFGVGGQILTISAFDYAPMMYIEGMPLCFFDLRGTGGEFPVNAIVLGTPVMNAFYSVFDLDRKEIRLAPLNHTE